MNVNKVYFNGRPDGLGNRLEELIKLQIYCTNFDKKIIYRWNNSGSFKYPVIFDCKDITIVEEKNEFNGNTFEKTTKIKIPIIINGKTYKSIQEI